jgi:hypothetical protein
MPSANDFAASALKLLGVIDPTEDPSAEDGETAFDVLNRWIDGLGTQRHTIYFLQRTAHTLVSGTASYTIGINGTINIARPLWIDHANLILDTGAATPRESPIRVLQDDEYANWPQKTFQSSYAGAIWYDHNWSSGLGRIYPLPIPNVGTTQLVIYTPTALTEFADQSTIYTFPPGYRRAIVYNLAMELSAHYPGATPPQTLPMLAETSLANIKKGNVRPSSVVIDPALTRRAGTLSRMRFLSGDI